MFCPPNFSLKKAAYSLNELTEVTSLCRTKIFELVKSGRLRATKCGRRTLFLATDISDFLSRLPPAGGQR
jgi:excisionase family DNA binding protein